MSGGGDYLTLPRTPEWGGCGSYGLVPSQDCKIRRLIKECYVKGKGMINYVSFLSVSK